MNKKEKNYKTISCLKEVFHLKIKLFLIFLIVQLNMNNTEHKKAEVFQKSFSQGLGKCSRQVTIDDQVFYLAAKLFHLVSPPTQNL